MNKTATTIAKPTPLDLVLLTLQALIFASAFLAIKVVVPETGPWWLAALRVSFAFLFLLPLVIFGKEQWQRPQNIRDWRLLSIVMAFNIVVPFFLISWAELTIDAGVAALLMGTAPFAALIGSHITTNDDRFTRPKLFGVLTGFLGILVLVGGDALRGLGQNIPAQAMVIIAAVCYTTSGLVVRRIHGFSPLQLSTWVLGLASISSIMVALLIDGIPDQFFSHTAWLGLLYLGLVPTGLGILLRYYLVNRIGVSRFAMGMNLIPVFGVAMGVIFLDEHLSSGLLIALTLIVLGQFIIQRGKA